MVQKGKVMGAWQKALLKKWHKPQAYKTDYVAPTALLGRVGHRRLLEILFEKILEFTGKPHNTANNLHVFCGYAVR